MYFLNYLKILYVAHYLRPLCYTNNLFKQHTFDLDFWLSRQEYSKVTVQESIKEHSTKYYVFLHNTMYFGDWQTIGQGTGKLGPPDDMRYEERMMRSAKHDTMQWRDILKNYLRYCLWMNNWLSVLLCKECKIGSKQANRLLDEW